MVYLWQTCILPLSSRYFLIRAMVMGRPLLTRKARLRRNVAPTKGGRAVPLLHVRYCVWQVDLEGLARRTSPSKTKMLSGATETHRTT